MDECDTVSLLSMHHLQKQYFVVPIAAKNFEENFLIVDQGLQVISLLQHSFFLMASCQLKLCGFKLSSLIWKLSPGGHVVLENLW
jgi:hypothetical protein